MTVEVPTVRHVTISADAGEVYEALCHWPEVCTRHGWTLRETSPDNLAAALAWSLRRVCDSLAELSRAGIIDPPMRPLAGG